MTFTSSPESQEALALLQRALQRSPAAMGMGITASRASPGQARLGFDVASGMATSLGVCHGGYLFALADTAGAYACMTRGAEAFTQTAHITYVAPGRVGEHLRADAVEVMRAGRNAVYDVSVTNPAGDTVALWRGTFRFMQGPQGPSAAKESA